MAASDRNRCRRSKLNCIASVATVARLMKKPLASVMAVLAGFFVLQFYLVRELLAAELLFGLGFAVLLVLGGLAYLVGSVAERGLKSANAGVRLTGGLGASRFERQRARSDVRRYGYSENHLNLFVRRSLRSITC